MGTDEALSVNGLCIAFAWLALTASDLGKVNQTDAFIVAALVAAPAILYCAWRAASGDSRQIWAAPVTAMILFAVFDNFHLAHPDIEGAFCILLLAVTLGTSVVAPVSGWGRPVTLLTGTILGTAGIVLTLTAIRYQVPGYRLFVPIDAIQTFNPLHIDFFPKDPSRVDGTLVWRYWLFGLQTAAVSAWDALILGIGVAITALIVFLPLEMRRTA
jgi:hypothetical protein